MLRRVRPSGFVASSLVALALVAGCAGESGDRPGGSAVDGPASEEVMFTVRGRWPTRAITYRIEERGAPVDVAVWRRTVERACAQWSAVGGIELVAAAHDEAADVTLGWRRGHHGACEPFGTNATVAHSGPVRRGTFVHFDAAREWVVDATDPAAGNSLFGTAMHELGHVLGLGHSSVDGSVMQTGVVVSRALARSDRCGLWSLYGGGSDAAGDVFVRRDGARRAALRGVAPRGRSAMAVFDADADGAADVLVWRTDRKGNGVLMVYHFAAGPLLQRTTGPYYGVASPSGDNGVVRLDGGERLFVTRFGNGRVVARRFDEHALLQPFPGYDGTHALVGVAVGGDEVIEFEGDLDGDGRIERVVTFGGGS